MRIDGDLVLLAFFVAVGVLPGIADGLNHRAFGSESTLGLILAGWALLALAGRVRLQLAARRLRRQLLP